MSIVPTTFSENVLKEFPLLRHYIGHCLGGTGYSRYYVPVLRTEGMRYLCHLFNIETIIKVSFEALRDYVNQDRKNFLILTSRGSLQTGTPDEHQVFLYGEKKEGEIVVFVDDCEITDAEIAAYAKYIPTLFPTKVKVHQLFFGIKRQKEECLCTFFSLAAAYNFAKNPLLLEQIRALNGLTTLTSLPHVVRTLPENSCIDFKTAYAKQQEYLDLLTQEICQIDLLFQEKLKHPMSLSLEIDELVLICSAIFKQTTQTHDKHPKAAKKHIADQIAFYTHFQDKLAHNFHALQQATLQDNIEEIKRLAETILEQKKQLDTIDAFIQQELAKGPSPQDPSYYESCY